MSQESSKANVLYFGELDALRFFAFLFVFFAHSFYSKIPEIQTEPIYLLFRKYGHLGIYGVNFFFVLSGFLITYLLLREKDLYGTLSIRNFYVRRVLRIWPLYFLIIFIGFVLVPISQHALGNHDYIEKAALWPYLIFINNFFPEPSTAILGVLWSIAVEEQFYAFWPLLLFILPRRALPYLFLFLIIFSLLWRTFIYKDWGYLHSLSCMSDLCIGSLLAYMTYHYHNYLQSVVYMSRWKITFIYLLGFLLFVFRDPINQWINSVYYYNNERLIFSIFFAFVIYEQSFCKHSFFKFSRIPYISRLGVISYGLYMLHFCAIYIVSKGLDIFGFNTKLYHILLVEPLIALGITIILAEFSYRYFERYFLNLKEKFSSFRTST